MLYSMQQSMYVMQGLWIGIICGPFVQTIFFGTLIWLTKWDKEASVLPFHLKHNIAKKIHNPYLLLRKLFNYDVVLE